METVERDYTPKGVAFYYVYKALAHPEYDNYVTPFTLEERLMHVVEAKRTLGSRIPWLVDAMTNEYKDAMAGMNNAEVVVSPAGTVAARRAWSDPEALRADLERLVGKVEKPTRVADLDLVTQPPPPTVKKGVVPRIETPTGLRALLTEPDLGSTEVPFYTKLRAEAEPELLDDGGGKLYLGFHLDPLYRVHWNNEAKPLEFEVTAPEGLTVTPARATAPKVEEPADADPREFLLDVLGTSAEPLTVKVRYYACDDANTFCIPVTQSYAVHLEGDRFAGRVFGRGGSPGGSGGGERRGGFGGPGGDPTERMKRFDADGDGRITRDEAPERMRQRFERMDTNGDGAIDEEEMKAMAERFQGMRGGRATADTSGGRP